MKKLISLVLLVLLTLGAASAFAQTVQIKENASAFDVALALPDDATYKEEVYEGATNLAITPSTAEGERPVYQVSIAAGDEYDGRALADLTEEEKQQIIDAWSIAMEKPTYAFVPLSNGNTALVMEENTEENDFAFMITLYKGYFFHVFASYEDYRKLTADDMAFLYQLADGLVITDVEAAK